MNNWPEIEAAHEMPVYSKRGPVIVRGSGAKLWDSEGKSYIDCVGGHGTATVGHANPAVVEAIRRQSEQLISCPEAFTNNVRAELLSVLAELSPICDPRIFLCNSGAEAVETAIKIARASTGRIKIIAAKRGFHGRTFGALSATHGSQMRTPFEPLVPGFSFIPFNDSDALESAICETTAAVILEPIQGEGGVRAAQKQFIKTASVACEKTGALLIIDEVQTGFCRTGSFFAIEHYGIEPDVLCLAKGIAGGVPMGAVICADQHALCPGQHGSTFGGNPLSSAAALAAIKFMKENCLDQTAERKGQKLLASLKTLECSRVREVRGRGLMVGIELREKVFPILKALMANGVLALPAGSTVLRLLPPLVIEDYELEMVSKAIGETLRFN